MKLGIRNLESGIEFGIELGIAGPVLRRVFRTIDVMIDTSSLASIRSAIASSGGPILQAS
jgi:hypothetical protein